MTRRVSAPHPAAPAGDPAPDRDEVALRWRGGSWTWAELRERADRARELARSVEVGGCVVVVADHSPHGVAAVLGVLEADRRVALVENDSSDLRRSDGALAALAPSLVLAPCGTDAAVAPPSAFVDLHGEWPDPDGARPVRHVRTLREDHEVLQLTSGSTGRPKLARQTRSGVAEAVRAYQENFDLGPTDHVLVPVPVVHSYGLAALLSSLAAGASVSLAPLDSPAWLLEEMVERSTVVFGTPLFLRLVAGMWGRRARPRHLRLVLSAGAPVPTAVDDAVRTALGQPVRQIYGTTEAGLVACVPARCTAWPTGSVGRFVGGVETATAADGTLLVRGPGVFRGYVGGGDREPGSFWGTGDVVTAGPEDFVTVVGRNDRVVKVGARRVATAPVVDAVLSCAGVIDAAVTVRTAPGGEDRLVALVVAPPSVSDEDVVAACRSAGLAAHEVPREVVRVDRLPRTGIHKLPSAGLADLVGRAVQIE